MPQISTGPDKGLCTLNIVRWRLHSAVLYDFLRRIKSRSSQTDGT